MPIELPPAAFIWSLFAVTTLGALLRLSFENREDHFVLTIAATVDAALLGRWSLALVWGSVLLAMPMVLAWSFVPANRDRLGGRGARRSVLWMVVSAASISIGFFFGDLAYAAILGGTYPVPLDDLGQVLRAGVGVTVAWLGTMSVRLLSIRAVSGGLDIGGFDPLDNVLIPYLMPLMGGFPLVVAAVALYAPAEPWPSLFILWWCVPLFAATAFDLHRRRLAQELRRDLLAKQRLAAIGEVSARIVHQSRHQVGIMGWSIHHLRPLVGRSDPEAVAVANAELDALAEAKDRLGAMLASELLAERATTPDEALEPPNSQVALADLVADVVAELGPRATSAGVELRLDLGATDGTAAVPPALRDVAFNLVDNAIDAAASEVVVRVGPGAAEALLVIDDGPGLDGSSARRAFEPFFTTKADGTGMGLAIADAVVAELGGDVAYRRSDGRTVFAVTLSEGTDSQRHEA